MTLGSIIQDSDNDVDWRQEVAIMGDIYANSHLTLAASTSPNSNGGLLHTREPTTVWPCRLIASWKCFPAGEVVVSVPEWASEKDLEPLASRAWVFQEWLLSKRSLHFAKDQVRWQCYCLAASEIYPNGSSGGDDDLDVYGIPAKSTIVRLSKNPDQAAEFWIKIREDYSRKLLTRPTDRLAALSGIARMVHRVLRSTDSRYLAGLWGPSILEELLWQRDSAVATTRIPTTDYIAPTWSWAALQYPFLRFHPGGLEEVEWKIHVVDVKVSAVDDAFGSVKHGSLTLDCSLSLITLTSQLSQPPQQSDSSHQWIVTTINNAAVTYPCSLSLDDPRHPATGSPQYQFYFMPIRASFWPSAVQNATAGLVLQKTGNRRGQYYRIGLLNIFSGKNQQVLISTLEKGTAVGNGCYLEADSRAVRVVEIV